MTWGSDWNSPAAVVSRELADEAGLVAEELPTLANLLGTARVERVLDIGHERHAWGHQLVTDKRSDFPWFAPEGQVVGIDVQRYADTHTHARLELVIYDRGPFTNPYEGLAEKLVEEQMDAFQLIHQAWGVPDIYFLPAAMGALPPLYQLDGRRWLLINTPASSPQTTGTTLADLSDVLGAAAPQLQAVFDGTQLPADYPLSSQQRVQTNYPSLLLLLEFAITHAAAD